MKRIVLGFSVILGILQTPSLALAWGQFGHEQVNHAAVVLIGTDTGFGQCLNAADYTMRRLAITPDMEWKSDVRLTLPDDVYKQRMSDNRYEHPLHFFEADAFVNLKAAQNTMTASSQEILALPTGEYVDAYPTYHDLLATYNVQTTKIDPSKTLADPSDPTLVEVTNHGTAPWRAQQLYRLAVDAMKAGDTQKALMYLGTMGHYVGDMSQPFHATLDYDGGFPEDADQAGIHHEIDSGLLPGSKAGSKDSMDVYPAALFESTTQPAVLVVAKGILDSGLNNLNLNYEMNYEMNYAQNSALDQTQVVSEIMKLVASGFSYVNPLLKSYQTQCDALTKKNGKTYCAVAKAGAPTKNIDAAAERAMAASQIRVSNEKGQVVTMAVSELLNQRLGESAALLERLWLAAYAEAGSPEMSGCGQYANFDSGFQQYVIMNYPRPDDSSAHGYMPTSALNSSNGISPIASSSASNGDVIKKPIKKSAKKPVKKPKSPAKKKKKKKSSSSSASN